MAQFTLPNQVRVNQAGLPYAGAKLYFYAAGTLTPLTVYQDSDLTTPHTQPVVANDNGYWQPIFVNSTYRVQVRSYADTLLDDFDNITVPDGLTASVIGAALYPRTQAEIDAGVIPVDKSYPPGEGRRQDMTDDSTTDQTAAFQDVVDAAAGVIPVTLPRILGGYYRITGRVTWPAGTHIVLQGGAELRATATTLSGTLFNGGATRPGFEITGDNAIISGYGTLRGPTTSGNYVENEIGVYMVGTSTSARKTGLTIMGRIDIRNWGAYGVLGQFVNQIQVGPDVRIFDCGYAGAMFLSCNSGRFSGDVNNITPGTGGNAYGLSLTHYSEDFDLDQTVNPFCRDWLVDGTVSNVPLWAGIDAHGGHNINFIGAKVFNCRFPLAIASGSGDAANYAGTNNAIMGCVATSLKRDGSASTIATPGAGITVNGGSTDSHHGVRVIGNVVDGYGATDLSVASISATRARDAIVQGNTLRNWKGRGINADIADISILDNVFGAVASATASVCIKVSGSSNFVISGNRHKPISGTAALEGLRVDDASTPRLLASDNDFSACTSQQYADDFGGALAGTRFRDTSDVPVIVNVTGTPTTISVAIAGKAPHVLVTLNVSGPSTVTDITGAFIGQRITLYSPTTNATTFDRTNAALAGGANYVSSQYDTLTLLCVATSSTKFVELGRAANS